MLYCNF